MEDINLTAVVRYLVLFDPYLNKRYVTDLAYLPIELHDVYARADERAEELSVSREQVISGKELFEPRLCAFRVQQKWAKKCLAEALKSLQCFDLSYLESEEVTFLPQPAQVFGWAVIRYSMLFELPDYTRVYAPVRLGNLCYHLPKAQIKTVREPRFYSLLPTIVHDANGHYRLLQDGEPLPKGFVVRYKVYFHKADSLRWLWRLCLNDKKSYHDKLDCLAQIAAMAKSL